jgi:hypothetical protein
LRRIDLRFALGTTLSVLLPVAVECQVLGHFPTSRLFGQMPRQIAARQPSPGDQIQNSRGGITVGRGSGRRTSSFFSPEPSPTTPTAKCPLSFPLVQKTPGRSYGNRVLRPPKSTPAFVFVVVPPASWLRMTRVVPTAALISRRLSRRRIAFPPSRLLV